MDVHDAAPNRQSRSRRGSTATFELSVPVRGRLSVGPTGILTGPRNRLQKEWPAVLTETLSRGDHYRIPHYHPAAICTAQWRSTSPQHRYLQRTRQHRRSGYQMGIYGATLPSKLTARSVTHRRCRNLEALHPRIRHSSNGVCTQRPITLVRNVRVEMTTWRSPRASSLSFSLGHPVRSTTANLAVERSTGHATSTVRGSASAMGSAGMRLASLSSRRHRFGAGAAASDVLRLRQLPPVPAPDRLLRMDVFQARASRKMSQLP